MLIVLRKFTKLIVFTRHCRRTHQQYTKPGENSEADRKLDKDLS